jgi:glutamate racemase
MITKLAAEKYLQKFNELNLSSLILGCTHYPLIKNTIGEVVKTELIDAGAEAVYKLKQEMLKNHLLDDNGTGSLEIFVSDEGMSFAEIASSFLGFDVKSGISRVDIEKY